MTKKNNQASTYLEEIPKDCSYLERLEEISFLNYPGKEDWRKRLMHTMLRSADDELIETVVDFCHKYKIPRRTLLLWVEKYPELKEAYVIFKMLLANRDIKGAKRRLFDKDVVFKYLHRLDEEWDDIDKRWAALKAMDAPEEAKGIKVVYIPATPDTGIKASSELKVEEGK